MQVHKCDYFYLIFLNVFNTVIFDNAAQCQKAIIKIFLIDGEAL